MIPNWRNYDAISMVLGYVRVLIIYRVPNQMCIYLRVLFAAIKNRYLWNHVIHLIIFSRVTSPTLEDFYCSSAGDVSLKNFGKCARLLTITNDNTHMYIHKMYTKNYAHTMPIIIGVHYKCAQLLDVFLSVSLCTIASFGVRVIAMNTT